jgi:hypothetical protein
MPFTLNPLSGNFDYYKNAPGGGGGATNLSYDAGTRVVSSDTGTDATLTLADGTNAGLMASADFTKLGGIAAGATVNSSDVTLLSRANHTGTQAHTTITGLGTLATQSGTFSGTSSGTNTGDNAVNSLYSGLVSNANHTGDATGSTALTLATVNSNVGTFGGSGAVASITVNAKGLVTAVSNVTISPTTTNLGYTAATRILTSDTGTDVTLPLFTSTDPGLTPFSGGGTTNFLRADGTWAATPGGATNLSYTAATRLLESSSGTDVNLPLFTSTEAGLAPLSGGGSVNFLRADGSWAVPPAGTPTFSVAATVTAGTNAQGQGPLTSDFNVITTAAANPSGVTLPTPTVGRVIQIKNRGANSVNVYPASGHTINALAANAAIALPATSQLDFFAKTTTGWESTSTPVSTGLQGLGTGVATFLATPTTANFAAAVTGETGTGAVVFGTAPAISAMTVSNAVTVTAGTNAQGQSALTTDLAIATTTAANPSGCTMPTATVGRTVTFINNGTNPVNLYPASGAAFDGLANNVAISVPVGGSIRAIANTTTKWQTNWREYLTAGVARTQNSGTAAMGTGAIASGASASTVTVAAANVTVNDVIDWGFNANPNSVTGYNAASTTGCLVITAFPTAGNVNFVVSNPTAASITPGALTLNWSVRRPS